MVTVLVVPDGAADPLGARPTCLEQARTPALDGALAGGGGGLARIRTIPEGLPVGTEVGLPGLLGADLRAAPSRGLIEAAAADVPLRPGEAAWRLDITAPSREPGDVAEIAGDRELVAAVAAAVAALGARVHPLRGHRLLLIGPAEWGDGPPGPHQTDRALVDVARGPFARVAAAAAGALSSAGLHPAPAPGSGALSGAEADVLPATGGAGRGAALAWPWGAAETARLPNVPRLLGRPVTLVAEGGAASGIGRLLGCAVVAAAPEKGVDVAGAAGDDEVVVIHWAGPDEAGHARSRAAKIDAIEHLDRHVIAPLLELLDRRGGRLIVAPDHGCDPATGRHTADPVPAALWMSRVAAPPGPSAPPGGSRLTERRAQHLAEAPAHLLLPAQLRGAERAA